MVPQSPFIFSGSVRSNIALADAGVSFERITAAARKACIDDEAQRLGLAGWVKNRVDGSVELEAEGPPERVAELLTWCEHGPPAARVSGVTVDELARVAGETGFTIRRTD